MSKSQECGTTILLRLEDCRAGRVWGEEENATAETEVKGRRGCSYCGSGRLYSHGVCRPREVLHAWSNGRKVCRELHRRRGKCRDCRRASAAGGHLVRSRSRLTRQAEAEALRQLRDRNSSRVTRDMVIGYATLRRLLEKETDEEALRLIQNLQEPYPDIDEHSSRHQVLVHTVTGVGEGEKPGIPGDARTATLREFLSKMPADKVREVCIDMKDGLGKAA